MKVLIIMPLAEQKGGSELALQHLMEYGQEQNIQWIVVFFEDGAMVHQFKAWNIETYVIPSGRLREPHRFLTTVAQIATLARQQQVDLIFSWMTKAHLYGGLASLVTRIPAMWYQWGMPSPRSWLDRWATRLPAAKILVCSEVTAKAQSQLLPYRPLQTVYPSVELEKFNPHILPSPQAARHHLNLPETGAIIGIVGRLQRWKGIHTVVAAMPKVLQKYPDAICLVVGGQHDLEADYRDFLTDRITALGLEHQVIMAGLQRNIPEWMQAMDVYIHASDQEPFGIVIIEAMALGKPLVAGNAGGPTEIITEGIHGLLTPYEDAEALSLAILNYLDHPDFARKMGAAAQERSQDFSIQSYVQNFVNAICQTSPTR
jgi:glycosyltransferase involved in cell wall biosynthesis